MASSLSSPRLFPTIRSTRIFPVSTTSVVYPVWSDDHYVNPGTTSKPRLGERYLPFGAININPPSGVTLSSAEYKLSATTAWTAVSAGSYPDLDTAIKYVAATATVFAPSRRYNLRITFSDSETRIQNVDTPTDVEILADKMARSSARIRPFCDARFTSDSTLVSSVKYEVTGLTTGTTDTAKTAISRAIIATATHDTSSLVSLVDTSRNLLKLGVRVGDIVETATGATMTISALSTTVNAYDTASGSLSSGTFVSGSSCNILNGASLDLVARNFELSFTVTGLYRATLYVSDSASNEESDTCLIRVRS